MINERQLRKLILLGVPKIKRTRVEDRRTGENQEGQQDSMMSGQNMKKVLRKLSEALRIFSDLSITIWSNMVQLVRAWHAFTGTHVI